MTRNQCEFMLFAGARNAIYVWCYWLHTQYTSC